MWLPCTVNMQHSVSCQWSASAQKVQSHSKVVFTIISPTICFIWKATFHVVLCVCTWIMHIRQCVVGLHGHKMYRKCPEHLSSTCSQQLLRRNKLPTGCFFFACLVFSPQNMNAFVTDFIVDNVVTQVQGFSSEILMIFFEKLCEMWRNLN